MESRPRRVGLFGEFDRIHVERVLRLAHDLDPAGGGVHGNSFGLFEGKRHNPGQYKYHWDGRDGAGFNVASGAYFAVLQAGGTRQSRMMTLIR